MKKIKVYQDGKEMAECYVTDDSLKSMTDFLEKVCRIATLHRTTVQFETTDDEPERLWRVTVKERKDSAPVIASHHGKFDKEGIIEFFGLHNSDVEWYRIEEIILIEEKENIKS